MSASDQDLILMDPTLRANGSPGVLAPRLDTLAGRTIGVIWNGKTPGDKMFEQIVEVLKADYGVRDVLLRRKLYSGNIAPPEVFLELAAKAHAVITGIGD